MSLWNHLYYSNYSVFVLLAYLNQVKRPSNFVSIFLIYCAIWYAIITVTIVLWPFLYEKEIVELRFYLHYTHFLKSFSTYSQSVFVKLEPFWDKFHFTTEVCWILVENTELCWILLKYKKLWPNLKNHFGETFFDNVLILLSRNCKAFCYLH